MYAYNGVARQLNPGIPTGMSAMNMNLKCAWGYLDAELKPQPCGKPAEYIWGARGDNVASLCQDQGKGLSAPRQRPQEAVAPPHGNETILLVEDERMVREVVARGLRDQGYTVIEATDGEEALALAREHGNKGVDLLFTDVVMPSMSGWVLASRMRAAMPGIKVLYTSGYTEETIGWGRLNDGNGAFIEKPFTPAELARRVRDVLES